jgi:hypothetical protein
MIGMKQIFAIVTVVIGASSCIGGILGCGTNENESSASKYSVGQRESIQACLERRGAAPALNTHDLDFLAKAEADEAVSKPAFVYDKVAKVVVDVWEGVTVEGSVPQWTLWYAHLFGDAISPWEIIESPPAKSYVFYINQAPAPVARRVRNCVSFSSSKGKTTVIRK